MRLFSKFVLTALVVSSLASIACAEMVYLDRRSNDASTSALERRASDGTVDMTFATGLGLPEGIALSPDGSILYQGDQGKNVKAYNTATGAQIGTGALFTATGKILGVAVDPATGDIYCAAFKSSSPKYMGWIEKYDVSEGTLDSAWGAAVGGTYSHVIDLEFNNGKLYGCIGTTGAGNQGVYGYDLSGANEGVPTLLGGTNAYTPETIAFAPDGTLYTLKAGDGIVRKWVSTDGYASSTSVIALTRQTTDMDYFDGSLYVGCRELSIGGADMGTGEIRMVDLSSPSEVTWASLPDEANFPRSLVVVAEIPEPSTLALLATGLFGLLAYAWRKRK